MLIMSFGDFLNIAKLTAAPAAGAIGGALLGYFLLKPSSKEFCGFLDSNGMWAFPLLGAVAGAAGGFMIQHGIPVLQTTS
jgi:hypothetical protein